MDANGRTALAEAVLSGLLKWETLRIQEYESHAGPKEEKEELLRQRRLETMFLLRRGLHVGFYQIVTRELKRDKRWDAQRAALLREAVQTLVSAEGTFEPGHHSKAASSKRRKGGSRQQQRRYHDYFPDFFFEPEIPRAARGRDKRFKILSTVFSPLDVPGYVPERSPFFVLDPRYVAAPRFMWTAQTVPGTLDFADDLVAFRKLVVRTMGDTRTEGAIDQERFDVVHRWLTTYGPIFVAFRAQVAAITSAYWFRQQDADRQRELIGVPCPRDDAAMDPRALAESYGALDVPAPQIGAIVEMSVQAARKSDDWWARFDARVQASRAAFLKEKHE